MKTDPKYLLNAGKVESEEDLVRQLGLEDNKAVDKIMWLALAAGFFVGVFVAIIAGLTYHHWKNLIF